MLGRRFGGTLALAASALITFSVGATPTLARNDQAVDPYFRNPAQQGDWRQYRGDANHRGWNQSESILSPATVGGLQILWRAHGGFNSSPAVANDFVYNGDAGPSAYAVDCASDGSYCGPLWHGSAGYPDWASPAIAGGMVYMQSTSGLFAYRVSCRSDGGRCDPVWTDPTAYSAYASPAVANGMLYAPVRWGELRAYNLAQCAAQGGTCSPTWTAPLGFEPYSSPAVSKGVVYIGGIDGKMYAFSTKCATNGGTCSPLWTADLHGPTNSSPAVANGEVYMPSADGYMYVFKVGCATDGGTCQPLWKAYMHGWHINGSPAVTNDLVYVPGGRRLYAFPVNCRTDGGLCTPTWRSHKTGLFGTFAASPAVANGVVYIPTQGKYQANGRLLAFSAECTSADHLCAPIWHSPRLGGMTNSSPAVAHGMVFVASNGGTFYAFGLPSAP